VLELLIYEVVFYVVNSQFFNRMNFKIKEDKRIFLCNIVTFLINIMLYSD